MRAEIIKASAPLGTDKLDSVVKALEAGGLAVLPADTVYGLVGKAFDAKVFERLNLIKNARQTPYPVVFSDIDELMNWMGEMNPFHIRLVRRLLPGRFTIVLPVNSDCEIPPDALKQFGYSDSIGVRVPDPSPLASVASMMGVPLWATSANTSFHPAPLNFEDVEKEVLDAVEVSVDGGEIRSQSASTVLDGRKLPYRILREGQDTDKLKKKLPALGAPLKVLVVCTGNICRSPFLTTMLGAKLGDVIRSGVEVTSAGTAASDGYPATAEMVNIAAEMGVVLTTHRARQLNLDLIDEADLILTAEPGHLRLIVQASPAAAARTRLATEPLGMTEIPDPYTGSAEAYQIVADLCVDLAEAWALKLRRWVNEASWQGALAQDR